MVAFLEEAKADKGWISHNEIARRMGVKAPSVSRWIESGLLSPVVACGSAYYFEQDIAEAFITGHVFIDVTAEIAGVQVDVIREWTRAGLLKPVSGPTVDLYYRNLFRCEDVERLRLQAPSAQATPGNPDR